MPEIKRRSGRIPLESERSFRERATDFLSVLYAVLDDLGSDAMDLKDEDVWKLTVKLKDEIYRSNLGVYVPDDEPEVE